LHRNFYQSQPGRTEGNDLSAAEHTDIVIEDIFRISRTKQVAGFCDVDLRNAKYSRRLLGNGSRTSKIAGILTHGLRIAPPGVPDHGSRLIHPKSAPGALHLQAMSFTCHSTFLNPPSQYYHRTAITSTMHSTTSGIANTFRPFATLCSNRQITRLLKTASTTHITRVESALSPYLQDRFPRRPQVIGRSRLMNSERKACLHTSSPTQRGESLPFLKTPIQWKKRLIQYPRLIC
jgi:hypothetical protein